MTTKPPSIKELESKLSNPKAWMMWWVIKDKPRILRVPKVWQNLPLDLLD